MNIRLGENRLSLAVKTLENEKKITANDFIKFFEQYSTKDSEQKPFLKSGIESHFRGDYISSLHTLIPQIEGTLRRVFEKKGRINPPSRDPVTEPNQLHHPKHDNAECDSEKNERRDVDRREEFSL